MKVSRHAKIIELISQYDIETQEELAEYLNNAGFQGHTGNCLQRYQRSEADKVVCKRWASEVYCP